MSSIKEQLREARLPEKTVDICLRGDLVAEYEAVEAAHDKAEEGRRDSLDAGTEIVDLAGRLDELRAQMAEANVAFRLRALARPKWRDLKSGHPVRKDGDAVDERDRWVGVDTSTFFEALVRACVVEPELDEDDWRLLLDERLTDRQFDKLATAAWDLNCRDVDVPFSRAASKTRTSGQK